ncbi:MarR family winged helix-turn-helix transcriptional regulator [Aeromicrobium duanguangcaii]|uniref:MarR family transcriptional regulator n=1 Tax=Aeromicrobium duanguangcaii TaxID=2968086 RepID=A0ABY5KF85_9ACTN|nr:MarR family transcriptional regulator [Aeromicrobium duanguangcaii]MCD9154870.1 MarR family transcriptional regulator [Aeromicrobium duanguangcaii]UUI67720.1 MarR family transcriptional regulator [Aeromicrobium duanguangcaii]
MLHHPMGATLRLKHAESALRRAVLPVLSEQGLTFEQWQVLAALREQPGLRMTDLAELAVLPAASLTRHVDHLVEHALVIRRVDPADKRRAVVALSGLGEQLAARVHDIEAAVAEDLDVPASRS